MGLLFAFVLSAVVLPAFDSLTTSASNQLCISSCADEHPASTCPLPLPEEEKEEEESRDDKSFSFCTLFISVELPGATQWACGLTAWQFNHTNTAALSESPIYLAQRALLI